MNASRCNGCVDSVRSSQRAIQFGESHTCDLHKPCTRASSSTVDAIPILEMFSVHHAAGFHVAFGNHIIHDYANIQNVQPLNSWTISQFINELFIYENSSLGFCHDDDFISILFLSQSSMRIRLYEIKIDGFKIKIRWHRHHNHRRRVGNAATTPHGLHLLGHKPHVTQTHKWS